MIRFPSNNIRIAFTGIKIWLRPRLFTRFICALFTLIIVNNTAIAESSGLSGLGEPSAPESLAHPDRLFPSDVAGRQNNPSYSKSPEPTGVPDYQPPIFLHPKIQQVAIDKPFTLSGAIQYSQQNYPQILKGQSEIRAAKKM